MIILIHFIIVFTASTAGAISGIGGGIIIKPLLDAIGLFEIDTINFLSGCVVLSMSGVSIAMSRRAEVSIKRKIGSLLAASGVTGGLVGKYLFILALNTFTDLKLLQTVQSAIFIFLTTGVLIFTIMKKRIKPRHMENVPICLLTGAVLGLIGAFLGIGGGPINLMVLYLFFSMEPKTAAINSLFVIFFSQLSSLILTILGGHIPEISAPVLAFMILGGISGAFTGSKISRRMTDNHVERLFIIVLIVIIIISIRNTTS